MNSNPRAMALAFWLAGLIGATGCLSPPVILDAGSQSIRLDRFSAGAEIVELPAEDGAILRGVYLDAGRNTPVVLVFLESGGTVAQGSRNEGLYFSDRLPVPGRGGIEDPPPDLAPDSVPLEVELRYPPMAYGCMPRLHALGASVLIIDSTGVGASSGQRDVRNIRRDAHLAWNEAVRRAGGAEDCVVLKGASLGVLSVACLLQDGARPAAAMLVAPIRAETIVRHGGELFYGAAIATLAAPLFADPVEVDLLEVIASSGVPVLVVVPRADVFLPPDEQRLLRDAVDRGGGVFLVRHQDHVLLAIAGRQLLGAERWFLVRNGLVPDPRSRLDDELSAWDEALHGQSTVRVGTRDIPAGALQPGQPARLRLEALLADVPPTARGAAAAVAIADLGEGEQLSMLNELSSQPDLGLDPVALANVLALDDPAIRMWPTSFASQVVRPGLDDRAKLERVLELVAETEASDEPVLTVRSPGAHPMWQSVPSVSSLPAVLASYEGLGLDAQTARRILTRTLLRQVGLPNRIPASATGDAELEVLVDGTWELVRLSGAASAAP